MAIATLSHCDFVSFKSAFLSALLCYGQIKPGTPLHVPRGVRKK